MGEFGRGSEWRGRVRGTRSSPSSGMGGACGRKPEAAVGSARETWRGLKVHPRPPLGGPAVGSPLPRRADLGAALSARGQAEASLRLTMLPASLGGNAVAHSLRFLGSGWKDVWGTSPLFFFCQATGLHALPWPSRPSRRNPPGERCLPGSPEPAPGASLRRLHSPWSFPLLSPPPPSALFFTRFPLPDKCTLTPLSFPAIPYFPISSRGAIVSSVSSLGHVILLFLVIFPMGQS